MILNTRTLFKAVLYNFPVDCICDVGSRDGEEALIFRNTCPQSEVLAFEANETNFNKMSYDKRLIQSRIRMYPFAIFNHDGVESFNILDPNDDSSLDIKGSSSLKENPRHRALVKKEVITRRLDNFILKNYEKCHSICLWIDVEGAEFEVMEGSQNIVDRILAIHVETAMVPQRIGQKSTADLDELCSRFGFVRVGVNFGQKQKWGDAVYFRHELLSKMGWKLHYFKAKAVLSRQILNLFPGLVSFKYFATLKKMLRT